MIDEPSSYLDVRQRLKAAEVIRSLLAPNKCDGGVCVGGGGHVRARTLSTRLCALVPCP